MKKTITNFVLGAAVIMLLSYIFEGVYVKDFSIKTGSEINLKKKLEVTLETKYKETSKEQEKKKN